MANNLHNIITKIVSENRDVNSYNDLTEEQKIEICRAAIADDLEEWDYRDLKDKRLEAAYGLVLEGNPLALEELKKVLRSLVETNCMRRINGIFDEVKSRLYPGIGEYEEWRKCDDIQRAEDIKANCLSHFPIK